MCMGQMMCNVVSDYLLTNAQQYDLKVQMCNATFCDEMSSSRVNI
jgi:hypothetical protein